MIVWLASYPRSGNTFFRILLNHLYGVRTSSTGSAPQVHRLGMGDIVGHEDLPDTLERLRDQATPFFVKTHHLPVDASPAVYLVRDGRDAVVSYARYRLTFSGEPVGRNASDIVDPRLFRRTLKDVILGRVPLGGWGDHVMAWALAPRGGGRTIVVRFEDLIRSPDEVTRSAMKRLELDIPPREGAIPEFDELHRKWPEFFRKGKVGGWQEEMPEALHRLFWKRHGEAMRSMGYGGVADRAETSI